MANVTGDNRIDSLLAGVNIKWQPAAGQSAPVVTYSFMVGLPTYASTTDGTGFSVFTESQKTATRAILDSIQSQFNISFVEVAESAADPSRYGQMRFGNNFQKDSSGYASYPDSTTGDDAGDVYISNDPTQRLTSNVVPGESGYSTLIHEIGHALGLKHPGNYNAGASVGSPPEEPPYLPTAEDSEVFTVMSYTQQSQGLQRTNWGPYDVAALTYLYGAKPVNAGNTTYRLADVDGRIDQTIVDTGGTDTLDASAVSVGATIDLRPAATGRISAVGIAPDGASATGNLSFGLATLIENVVGGKGGDTLIGNDANNIFTGGPGNDSIDGGAGTDTSKFAGSWAEYRISGASLCTVTDLTAGRDGTDTLRNVERLLFSDRKIALDIAGDANACFNTASLADAGQVYRLYQAAFNRTPDKVGLSYWIGQADASTTLTAIAGGFTGSAEFKTTYGSIGDHQFVDQLYLNVLHRPSDPAGVSYWYNQLDSRALTREQVLVGFSESSENQQALIGTIQNGIDYTA